MEYEIVCTFLNGCAGAAYPQTTFEETEIASPEDYLRRKHGKDFEQFVKETQPDGKIVYAYRDTVTYIYEFTEL